MKRKATAHYCSKLLKRSLKEYRENAKEFKRQRFLLVKTTTWMRKRFVGSSFRKWLAEANEAAYQRAAAAASHAAVVATRAMKKMFYARDLHPAFRAWVHLHRRHLSARAALESAGDFAARVFFLNAAVFSRWRCATLDLRRERTIEAFEANKARTAQLDEREDKLQHLLDGERKRGRAEKEGEVALAKMNEAAALRKSMVMERERRDAIAAVESERAKNAEAYEAGGKFAESLRAEEAAAYAAREMLAAEEREWLQRAVESAWEEVLWYRKRCGDAGAEMSLHDHLLAVTGPTRAASMLPQGYKAPWNHPTHSDVLPLDPVVVAKREKEAVAAAAAAAGEAPDTQRRGGLAGAIASIAGTSSSKAETSEKKNNKKKSSTSIAASKAETLLRAKTAAATTAAGQRAAAASAMGWLRRSKVPDPRLKLQVLKDGSNAKTTTTNNTVSPYGSSAAQNKPRASTGGAGGVSANSTVSTAFMSHVGARRRSKVLAGSGGHLPGSAKPRLPPDGRWGGGPATARKTRPWGGGNDGGGDRRRSRDGSDTVASEAKAVVATLSSMKNFSEAQWAEARESFIRSHEDAELAAAVAEEFDRERAAAASGISELKGHRKKKGGNSIKKATTIKSKSSSQAASVTAEAARAKAGSPVYEGEEELVMAENNLAVEEVIEEDEDEVEDEMVVVVDDEASDDDEDMDWSEDAAVAAAAVAASPSSSSHHPGSPRSPTETTPKSKGKKPVVRQRSRKASFAIDLDIEEEADHENLVRVTPQNYPTKSGSGSGAAGDYNDYDTEEIHSAYESDYDVDVEEDEEGEGGEKGEGVDDRKEAELEEEEERRAAESRRRRPPSHIIGEDDMGVAPGSSTRSATLPTSLRVKSFRQDKIPSPRGSVVERGVSRLSFNSQSSDGTGHAEEEEKNTPGGSSSRGGGGGGGGERGGGGTRGKEELGRRVGVPVPLTPSGYDSDDAKLFGRQSGGAGMKKKGEAVVAVAPPPATTTMTTAAPAYADDDDDDDNDWVFRKKK